MSNKREYMDDTSFTYYQRIGTAKGYINDFEKKRRRSY